MMTKIIQNPGCRVQQVFELYVQSWLADSEPPTPDISQFPIEQRDLLVRALEEQDQIGWDLGMRGYLSQHWGLAIAAHPRLDLKNDKGKAWTRRAILELWSFAHEMWAHRNAVLHNAVLEASRKIRDDDITKLYDKVDSFAAEDRWYFHMPLALRLKKPLRSRRRWLVNARVLAAKSHQRIFIGQMPLTAYYPHLESARLVVNRTLGPSIATVTNFIQSTLTNLLSWRLLVPTSRPQ
jgi:hypothetical protein